MHARKSARTGLAILLAVLPCAATVHAQTHLVGWGPNRFDDAWSAETFVEVGASGANTVALRADGTLAAWGVLGGPLADRPALPVGTSIVDLAVSSECYALLSNGDLLKWPNSQTYHFPTSPIVELSGGYNHVLVRLQNGQILGFGDSTFGQTGPAPALPSGTSYVQIAAGYYHSIALRSDGQIIGWGSNTSNQSPPPGRTFVQITAGWYHDAALLDDGTAIAWGITNAWGQLNVPPPPPGTTFVKLDAGSDFTLALCSDGTVIGWGDNSRGQCTPPALPPGVTYVDVSAGGLPVAIERDSHAAALRSDGKVVSWGWNGYTQTNAPSAATGTSYTKVSACCTAPDLGGPNTYSCYAALRSDGHIQMFGDDTWAQLVVPALPGATSYVDVDCGGLHAVAIRSDGRLVAWGNNSWGQLTGITAPPSGASYVQVSAGSYFSYGLLSTGELRGFGYSGAPLTPPTPPSGVTYVHVEVGDTHVAALRSDGQIVAWGNNTYGQTNVPALPSGVTYVDLAAGGYHTIAKRSDGVVVGWGWNGFGQTNVPGLPPGVSYVKLSAGGSTSAGLRSDGRIVTWGLATGGQPEVPPLDADEQYVDLSVGVGGLIALAEKEWTTYGTAKTNSLGCVPSISASGLPSASRTSGFVVRCDQLRNQTMGMLIYTVNGSPASTPFQCGTRLVGPTGIKRSPIRSAGGSALPATDCTGVFALDMNAYAAGLAGGTPAALLHVAGTTVHAQWWGRDNGFAPPCNTTLSDAIRYVVRP